MQRQSAEAQYQQNQWSYQRNRRPSVLVLSQREESDLIQALWGPNVLTCLANKADYNGTVGAMTVDNASKMDGSAKKLEIVKHGSFPHIFNPTSLKIDTFPQFSLLCHQYSIQLNAKNMVSISPSISEIWLSISLWCHIKVDLWLFEYKISPLYPFILFCHD